MVSCVLDGQPMDDSFVSCARRLTKGKETHGPSKGQAQYGIWELEGKTLKFCFSSHGQERPADFTTVPGDGRTASVWDLIEK